MNRTPLTRLDLDAYSSSLMGRHEPWDLEYRAAKATKLIIESEADLLESLKDLMNNIGGGKKFCGHDFTCSCAWDKAEQAIKKVEA